MCRFTKNSDAHCENCEIDIFDAYDIHSIIESDDSQIIFSGQPREIIRNINQRYEK